MMQMFSCKSQSVRVGGLLKLLIPAVQEICISDQQNPIFHEFYDTLIRGAELIKKCEGINTLNLPLNYRYASQIVKLEKEIDGFMKVIPAHILLEARGMVTDMRKNYPSEASDISKELENSIFKQASMLTSDPCENAKILQQLVLDDLMDCTESIEDSASSYHSNGSGISQVFVGLEKPIGDVKELLFDTEVSVVGVQCKGGGGKTTLALALCDDPKIKGHFGKNVFFFTVSQSPNLKGILESMWEKIVGKKKPDFQNVEDAHRHLEQQLLKLSKPTLVILDDVWSRASLEKLLFEGPGYKTLITTRDSSTIPRNLSTQLYQLPLLGHEDALSLFCYWAFGQTSIPCTADANLVKKVQAECEGLPLALKVTGSSLRGEPRVVWESAKNRLSKGEFISDYHKEALKVTGSSLRGEPRVVWESAKNKLSKGEFISDYHKEALYKCLETSVYLLDDVVRECSLDLGAFPEDRKICADALLDVWVYFRNLEWQDALAVLLELASRCLLNLISSNPGSGAAISHGSVSELYFTQHDVIRDLALYLGCQGDIDPAVKDGYLAKEQDCLDRRTDHLDKKEDYLSRRRDYLTSGENILAGELERDFLGKVKEFFAREQDFLSCKKDFVAIKKDFLTRKRESHRRVEDYYTRKRDSKVRDSEDFVLSLLQDLYTSRLSFLTSQRHGSTPSFDPLYDVFLSFRGKDVRHTLVDHLSEALSKAGLRVFLDSKNLKKGELIWPSLKTAIKKSAICIPIFSKGYSDSAWCLKEATAMVRSPGKIIPLFYDLDPTDVRYPLNKKSPYNKSFRKHYRHPDRHPKAEIDRWRLSLRKICSHLGWTMGITEDSEAVVERIVKDVIDILHSH